ncbi:hypothetical protein D0Y65_023857 [Glycine soja]|uniref:Uncharacterized protein n=1 Tax=Glycine soja TaxID=3848 RepID=A0A445IZV4_GLYSO|nr:hypothetical protein D0Y65_023857 [Glycine soja]
MTKSKGKDPLEGLGGPMTRARARKAKEALQQVLSILFEYKPKFQGEKSKVVKMRDQLVPACHQARRLWMTKGAEDDVSLCVLSCFEYQR